MSHQLLEETSRKDDPPLLAMSGFLDWRYLSESQVSEVSAEFCLFCRHTNKRFTLNPAGDGDGRERRQEAPIRLL